MAFSAAGQISQLTLAGSGSEALRNINRVWGISDVATVIPEHLHPQNKHYSNQWSANFQAELEQVSRVVCHDEFEEFKGKCQDTVDIRCGVKSRPGKKIGKRVTYLIIEDLKSVKRVFGHKRKRDAELENESMRVEEEVRLRAQEKERVEKELESQMRKELVGSRYP
jgi:hypothetical protein